MSEINFNKEILTTLGNCKDAKEIAALAKTRGITLSEEQANKIFNATHGEALTDEEMDMIVGGGDSKKETETQSCGTPHALYQDCDLCHGHYCASNTYGE